MNPRRHSRLRQLQLKRKVLRCYKRLVNFIYEENQTALDQHATNLIVYGYSKLIQTPEGKFFCPLVEPLYESQTPDNRYLH